MKKNKIQLFNAHTIRQGAPEYAADLLVILNKVYHMVEKLEIKQFIEVNISRTE